MVEEVVWQEMKAAWWLHALVVLLRYYASVVPLSLAVIMLERATKLGKIKRWKRG